MDSFRKELSSLDTLQDYLQVHYVEIDIINKERKEVREKMQDIES